MIGLATAYRAADPHINRAINAAIHRVGVPVDIDQGIALARDIYPEVQRQRRALYARETAALLAEFPAIDIAPPQDYPMSALTTSVLRNAGLTQQAKVMNLEAFDPETQKWTTQRIYPWMNPDSAEVVAEFARRMAASGAHHARQASRDAVRDTAWGNGMAYARVLTGKENCGFCALLASRGAVYRKSSALYKSDGSRYHPNCDCQAVAIKTGRPWAGESAAKNLYDLWIQSGDLSEFAKMYRKVRDENPAQLLSV